MTKRGVPISVKSDIKPLFGFGDRFSLGDTPVFQPLGNGTPIRLSDTGGRYVETVRDRVADRHWDEFFRSWNVQGLSVSNTKREVLKALASKFNLDTSERETFDALWPLMGDAEKYRHDIEDVLEADLLDAYRHVARIAAGDEVEEKTFSRLTTRDHSDHGGFVVFSDHHLTAFTDKPNYFADFNLELYLDVLEHYATRTDFCLVENGDLEECVIYEPTLAHAELRKDQARGRSAFPIDPADDRWEDFLETRYAQRQRTLEGVIDAFPDYYAKLRRFVPDRYVRLTGNHDTYLNEDIERPLRDRVQDALGTEVHDVCRIEDGSEVSHVILHGHQFDRMCMQHGAIPLAKSLGETFSESAGWAFQGPDRFWTAQDSKRWLHGSSYANTLASEAPGDYPGDPTWDLLLNNLNKIKADDAEFVEEMLDHQVAWEYFENASAFRALTLEVWSGEELYKLRHTNEVKLCERYASEFLNLQGVGARIPALVLGHTHEPRQNARDPFTGSHPYFYLNSGSAGRYENLLWCVEILAGEDRICSWSRVGGRLRKVVWRSEGSTLVHDTVEDV